MLLQLPMQVVVSAQASVVINPAGSLTLTTVETDALCNGDSSGTSTVTVSGGSAPYDYAFIDLNGDTISTNNPATNLPGGNYTVVVTDMGGCTNSAQITISQPSPIFNNTSGTNVSCNGGNNGTATVQAIGGAVPYSYLWSDGQVTQIATGLIAGSYTVIITDANGCTTIAGPVIVTQPAPIELNLIAVNPACYLGTDGSVTVSSTGGTTPYNYVWNTGVTGSVLGSIGAGTYTVTVTDYNGCTNEASVTLIQPDSLSCTSVQL